jgi:hypothetical protein
MHKVAALMQAVRKPLQAALETMDVELSQLFVLVEIIQ